MNDRLTFAASTPDAIPLHVVSEEACSEWLAQQSAAVAARFTRLGFRGKLGQTQIVESDTGEIAATGYGTDATRARGRYHGAAAARALPVGVYQLVGDLTPDQFGEAALGWLLASYRFDRYKSADPVNAQLVAPEGVDAQALVARAQGEALVRDLINTPSNDMGPAELEAAAADLADRHGAQIEVIRGEDLIALNFPLIHTVGAAAVPERAPRLIDLRHGDTGPRLTLVGKGVCFDTGGLNLKPGSSMGLMKKDMGGAAHVLGLAEMILRAGWPVRLRVLIPAVENAVAGPSFRPGDVYTARNGMTVEINNTDAEGRLVLADALSLAAEERPAMLISMATLTGAARVAVGPDLAPFFTGDEGLASTLLHTDASVADPVWRLPFHDPYEGMIEPAIADLDNAPKGGFAGSITAALFLRRFAQDVPSYTHFDVYGWNPSGDARPPGGRRGARVGGLDVGLAQGLVPVTQDRRTCFATDRVAHVSLQGQVARPTYAEATPHRVLRPVLDLCAAPSGALDRQVLWGQPLEALDYRDGWSFVRASRDGYVGWVETVALGDPVEATFRVSVPATHLYPAPDLKQPPLHWLSFGSEIRIVAGTGEWLETEAGHFVPKPHLKALVKPFPDWVTVAQFFFGVPYLWGGNSAAGIDCSGLVQAALRAGGHPCPGDSDQQAQSVGHTLAGDAVPERGDLYFWRGHVAIAVDGETLIHANAHHMATAYEPISDALARIEAVEGPLMCRKRL